MVADSEIVKRKLRDLRVVELRNELERRNLDKTGVKDTLAKRLAKALQEEGHDAEEFIFEMVEKKAAGKRLSVGKRDPDSNETDSNVDGAESSGPPPLQDTDLEIKEEPDNKDVQAIVAHHELDSKPTLTDESKCIEQAEESSLNQENNDGAEDFINLNLEEEEEFGDEEHHTKDKDETSLRMDSNQQQYEDDRPAKSPGTTSYGHSSSSGGGASDATTNNGNATRNDVGRVEEQNRDATENNKDAGASDQQGTSSTSSSGEKVKSGSALPKDGFKPNSRDDREKKKNSATSSRNLWVSGLSTTTRATDLKHLFSKYGKVVGAKVVTNARTPGARCYGYVTMSTSEEATECIQRLNRTELHGRMISVERAKGDGGSRKTEAKSSDSKAPTDGQVSGSEKSETAKEDGVNDELARAVDAPSADCAASTATGDALSISSAGNAKDNHDERSESAKDGSERRGGSAQRDRDRPHRDWVDHDRRNRPRRPSPHRPRQVLTHKQIKEEHERQRLREREREEHRAERRRQEELVRLREHERRQREEAFRLEKERERLRKEREQLERERLRFERERLEREKAELQRLERERLRFEREKAEAEELRKRSFTRIDDVRRAPKRPGERDDFYGERKRITVDSSIRYDGTSRYEDSSKTSGGHFGGATSGVSDYRGAKMSGDTRAGGSSFDSRARFERSAPAATSGASSVTRRVVQELPAARREARPHSPPPPRDRGDDRRIIDRARDDRYDRGNRGRDSYSDRDHRRDRERPRDERGGNGGAAADPIRNRIQDRDHRERYDSRSGKDRYNERGSDSWQRGSSGVASTSNAGGSKGSYSGGASMIGNGSLPAGNAWNSNGVGQSDRWGSSATVPMNRMSTGASFNNSWAASAPPLANTVFNAPIGGMGNLGGGVMGQSGSVGYSGDRYSSRH